MIHACKKLFLKFKKSKLHIDICSNSPDMHGRLPISYIVSRSPAKNNFLLLFKKIWNWQLLSLVNYSRIFKTHKSYAYTSLSWQLKADFHSLKVQSCRLYNNKYMIVSTQITNTKIFALIAALVFKLLSCKVLFINRKDNRNC